LPYSITYEPINRIAGVKAKTVTVETAAEAWLLVDSLQRSDEKAVVKDAAGRDMQWAELRDLAAKEAN
jgi:hypothetical protein